MSDVEVIFKPKFSTALAGLFSTRLSQGPRFKLCAEFAGMFRV